MILIYKNFELYKIFNKKFCFYKIYYKVNNNILI